MSRTEYRGAEPRPIRYPPQAHALTQVLAGTGLPQRRHDATQATWRLFQCDLQSPSLSSHS